MDDWMIKIAFESSCQTRYVLSSKVMIIFFKIVIQIYDKVIMIISLTVESDMNILTYSDKKIK